VKRILVAGGSGFVGSHLVDRLLDRSDVERVVVVDNLWTGSRDNLAHLHDGRLRIHLSDVENFASDQTFHEIYHLASPAVPKIYSSEPARTISANVIGAFRLRELLAPGGRFCFTSTSEVYGEPLVSPQPESYRGSVDCTGPRSSYDEGKRCTEAFLFECQRAHGMNVRVARVFNTYGPRTRIDDGRAISNFIGQALKRQPIMVYGDGKQSRCWGYVDDIIEGLAGFFFSDTIEFIGPINIGNDREISVIEVAQYIQRLVPGTLIEFAPPLPQDPTNRCPDLTLARRLLPGWKCAIEYEEGVRRTIEWFTARMDLPAQISTVATGRAAL